MFEFEVMTDSKTGLLFTEDVVSDFAVRIVFTMEHPSVMATMGNYSEMSALKNYSMGTWS